MVLGLAFAWTPWAAGAQLPDVLRSPDPTRDAPAWVAADVAITSAGFNPEFFPAHELRLLDSKLDQIAKARAASETPTEDCPIWVTTTVDRADPKPNHSLAALANSSRAVYAGVVTEMRQGFLYGAPGAMLEVEVSQALKHPGRTPPTSVLVFYQFAKIPVGTGYLCAHSDRGKIGPAVGSRILLFALRGAGGSDSAWVYPDDEEVLFETPDGSLSLPRGLTDVAEDLPFDDLVEAAQRIQVRDDRP